jgi:hypothetical protein
MTSANNSPRIYIATTTRRRREAEHLAMFLRECGFEVVSTWQEKSDNHLDRAVIGERDMHEVSMATHICLLSESRDNPHVEHGGRFWEAAVGYRSGAKVVVVGVRENVFLHMDSIVALHSASDLVDYLKKSSSTKRSKTCGGEKQQPRT